jgi:hypothetical protein
VLPNFLILGAQKAGTTWLAKCLGEHPDVFVPEIKEIYYFTHNYGKGLKWYESFFADWSGEKAVGEGTVSYIKRREAPQRIRETLGDDVKLIASLRHPVERAYSAYRMYWTRGSIPQDTDFRTFVDQDILEARTLGLYHDQVERYLEQFPRENMLVLIYDEMQAGGDHGRRAVVSRCLEHLALDAQFIPPSLDARVNAGIEMKLFHHQVWGLRRAMKKLPRAIDRPLASVGRRIFDWFPKKAEPEPLEPGLKQELMSGFKLDIERLEHLLDRDLSIWYG